MSSDNVIGINPTEVADWMEQLGTAFTGPGLWKIAVIAEGVMRRAMDVPQNKAAAGTPIAGWIDALVCKAREVAEDAGI